MVFPGPVQLGRGVVVNPGDPDPIDGLPRVRVDQNLLDGAMKLCYANRQPVAVCLTQRLHGGKFA